MVPRQALTMGAVGLAYVAARVFRNDSVDPIVAECGVRGAIGTALSRLKPVLPDEELRAVAVEIQTLQELAATRRPMAQWQLSHGAICIGERLTRGCDVDPVNSNDDALRTALYCRDDVVPEIVGHLDDLVHNFLLDVRV